MKRNAAKSARLGGSSPAKRASRQKERTQTTRRKLIEAAERIFARDGFEAARLEDIASEAGYTRGAFYANFESKEDIFFALLERWMGERIEQVNSLLRKHDTPQKRLRALREHYAQLAHNRGLALLSLEFKLFAIRHPESHKRLRAWQQRLRTCGGEILSRVMKKGPDALPISPSAVATGLGALSNALLLDHLVDPASLPQEASAYLLAAFFDAVIQGKFSGKSK
jgi:AcrR family transcriptional regulator